MRFYRRGNDETVFNSHAWVLDYATAAGLLALPRVRDWPDDVARMMTVAALGTVAYSVVTRYELGLLKVLPMRAHLALDGLSGALFCAAPLLFPRAPRPIVAALVGIGLFEVSASLLTETVLPTERQLAAYTNKPVS